MTFLNWFKNKPFDHEYVVFNMYSLISKIALNLDINFLRLRDLFSFNGCEIFLFKINLFSVFSMTFLKISLIFWEMSNEKIISSWS